MNVLVLNAGSSSLKFQLIQTGLEQMAEDEDVKLARGVIERIGGEAMLAIRGKDGATHRSTAAIRDHAAALEQVLRWLTRPPEGPPMIRSLGEIDAVGHRVVHGGEQFRRSVVVTDAVHRQIEDMVELAPLHNPHNLRAIQAARSALGSGVPQVAVFDTAFHHTLPDHAYLYALPYSLYRRHRVRRYGFHGTSHRYVAYRYRRLTGVAREEARLITLHLGNGCSACANSGGNSIDTSMGFTPLEGLVMGTRAGDLDPAILEFVAHKEGMNLTEVDALLNKQSGLLGISGLTHDMRDLLAEESEHDDRRASLAIQIFAYRARKYIGAYLAAMGGADAIVFTGGIGENSAEVRRRICQGLDWMGLALDSGANERMVNGEEGQISTSEARLAAWVIPTDEELLIARDTVRLVSGEEMRD
jgi:acetate kinase